LSRRFANCWPRTTGYAETQEATVLRKVDRGWRFISVVLALALAFLLLWNVVPTNILIQVLNGVFFGTFISIVGAYGPLLLRTFFGDGYYDRTFHYSTSVAMQWTAMLAARATSVWFRVIDESNAINDNIVVAGIAYLSLVAIIWQSLVLTEDEPHDRHVLIGATAAGGVVAVALIILQSYGSALWAMLSP
jgi:hypothetical protein